MNCVIREYMPSDWSACTALFESHCPEYADTFQPAFLFFEKLGFKVVNIVKQVYGEELDRYDMVKE